MENKTIMKMKELRKLSIVGIASVLCILCGCAKQEANTTKEQNKKIEEQEDSSNVVKDKKTEEQEDSSNVVKDKKTDEQDDGSDVVEDDKFDESRIIEDQSFDIELNEWGKVKFVSCSPDTKKNPLADATFYIIKEDEDIYKLPSIDKGDIRSEGSFEGISFVAFKDINKDDKEEIIIGARYITKDESKEECSDTQVRVFQDKGDSFEYNQDLSEYITSSISEDASIDDVYKQITWYDVYKLDMASLYKQIKTVDNPKKFEGSWSSTNCHSSDNGTIEITKQNNKGFHYKGAFMYYYHTGEVDGEAHWVSDSIAISNQDDVEDSMEDGYMIFYMVGDSLYVRADSFFGTMGMDVTPTNEYTLGKPVYTNDGILKSTYSDKELEQIKSLLGNEIYDDSFIFLTKCGGVVASEKMLTDGTTCKYIECYMPTQGDGYKAVITSDGKIYIKMDLYYIKMDLYKDEKLYTNDSNWKGKNLPKTK